MRFFLYVLLSLLPCVEVAAREALFSSEQCVELVQERLEDTAFDAEELRAFCNQNDLQNILLERLPALGDYFDPLAKLVKLDEAQRDAAIVALSSYSNGNTVPADILPLVKRLRVSEKQAEAIILHVERELGSGSREARKVRWALDKLRSGEFGAAGERILLRDGGGEIQLLPAFVSVLLSERRLIAEQERLGAAQERLGAAQERLGAAQETLRLLESALELGRQIIESQN